MAPIQTSFQNNFPNYFETITQISKDDSQEKQTNLFCKSMIKLFNFEKFCQIEMKVKDYDLVDALFCTNDSFIFIEFKSGKNIKPSNVRLKIVDSIILLSEAIKNHLNLNSIQCEEYQNYKKIYIVVYDHTKNSSQRTSAITCHFTNMPIRFNLEFYAECFLHKVHTPSCDTQFKKIMQHYGVSL
jgi:hypothetical protein